jgi:uncharacterized membrane protein YidH (DUF202 family)
VCSLTSAARRGIRTDRLAGPLGRYEGVALTLVGIALILVAGVRFVRTTRMIDASEPQGSGLRGKVAITIVLVLLGAVYCVSFVVR